MLTLLRLEREKNDKRESQNMFYFESDKINMSASQLNSVSEGSISFTG